MTRGWVWVLKAMEVGGDERLGVSFDGGGAGW